MTLQVYDYTDDQLRELMTKVQREGLAIFTEQWCDEGQLTSIFKRTGECEAPGLFMNDPDDPEIFKVSGESLLIHAKFRSEFEIFEYKIPGLVVSVFHAKIPK